MKKVWLCENEQARWFEFEEPDDIHDMPNDVTVTMLTETEQPAQRTWVGLTDEEIDNLRDETVGLSPLIRAVEAKLKEKNT
jgi:hypothetical protein